MRTAVLVVERKIRKGSSTMATFRFAIPDLLAEHYEKIEACPTRNLASLPYGKIRNLCELLLPSERWSLIESITVIRSPEEASAIFELQLADGAPYVSARGRVDSALRLCRCEPLFG